MSGVNPEGCEVYSFKQPSAEELQHDFLWRSSCRLPERPLVEDILVVGIALAQGEVTRPYLAEVREGPENEAEGSHPTCIGSFPRPRDWSAGQQLMATNWKKLNSEEKNTRRLGFARFLFIAILAVTFCCSPEAWCDTISLVEANSIGTRPPNHEGIDGRKANAGSPVSVTE